MARLCTVADIIDPLGGTNSVADKLGINPSVVSSWKKRGHIPSRNWDGVLALARQGRVRGITLAALASLTLSVKPNGAAGRRAMRRRKRMM